MQDLIHAVGTQGAGAAVEKPTARALEALVRKQRRKHFKFDKLNCSSCIARERREYAADKRISTIEAALVAYGSADVIMLAFPALASLIKCELEYRVTDDNPDF